VKAGVIVAAATLLALVGGIVYAGNSGSSIASPLDRFGLHNKAYRCMNITALYTFTNTLSGVSPPPWYPNAAPKPPAVLTCGSIILGEKSSTVLSSTARIPCNAPLGGYELVKKLTCSYTAWYRDWYPVCLGWYNGTCTETSTTTVTQSYLATTTLAETATATIIPRRVDSSLLVVSLNITGYRVLGNGSVLVNASVVFYNLGQGLRLGNKTLVPMEKGMLLLHNLAIYVDGVSAVNLSGYGAPAQPLPVNGAGPEPSATGTATLVLEPPGKPTNEYTFNVTICYTEDRPEPVRTCIADNVTVSLPFGWRLVRYIADDCRVINETWEIVPANETGYETVLVENHVEPSLREDHDCIVASAGACEEVVLRVYEDGDLVASRTARGSITWCPAEPGTYTVTAMDYFNNTVTRTFSLTWSTGPPPALRHTLLSLAATIIALMIGMYIILGGRWPLRGP